MAAPWTVERNWRSASRVRHSPPPQPTQQPAASSSPPVPALRAKTAHPSLELRSSQDEDNDDDIIEEIENIFDDFDLQSDTSSGNR